MSTSLDLPLPENRPSVRDRLLQAPWRPLPPAFQLSVHALALTAILRFPFHLAYLPLMLGMYFWMCGATSLYMHRTLSHRSLRWVAPLDLFWCLGTSMSLGGDPVRWVALHRHHHAHADTPDDIHSPRSGFWFSHGMWVYKLYPAFMEEMLPNAADVAAVPYRRWMLRQPVYMLPHVVVAAMVGYTLGWGALLWGVYLPLALLVHVTHAVNSIGHLPRFGYRRYDLEDDSTNVPWLALATFGDSFHNNHHAQPRRAGHGRTWWEIDVNKGVIWLAEKLGLARDVVW